VGHRDAPVAARASVRGVVAPVLDQLVLARALLAQLQTRARSREVRVALLDRAAVLGPEGERQLQRPRRLGVAGLEFDVAGRCGQGARDDIVAPCRSASSWSSTRCWPTASP
jgi:hypothetical protein